MNSLATILVIGIFTFIFIQNISVAANKFDGRKPLIEEEEENGKISDTKIKLIEYK